MADEIENWTFLNKPSPPNYWLLAFGEAFFSSQTEGNQLQAHHLIPREVLTNPDYANFFNELKVAGFDPNDFNTNGIYLPTTDVDALRLGVAKHIGPHAEYTEIADKLFGEVEQVYNGRIEELVIIDDKTEAEAKATAMAEALDDIRVTYAAQGYKPGVPVMQLRVETLEKPTARAAGRGGR